MEDEAVNRLIGLPAHLDRMLARRAAAEGKTCDELLIELITAALAAEDGWSSAVKPSGFRNIAEQIG